MAGPLRREEQQKIIQLYESGVSIADIKEQTGRSRDAITNLLKYTGLDGNSVDSLIWNEAYHTYESEKDSSAPYWRKCPIDIRQKYYDRVRPGILKACKAYRDRIMADIENPIITNYVTPDTKVVVLKESTIKQLDYISEVCGGISYDNLVEFIITKEFLELKKREK